MPEVFRYSVFHTHLCLIVGVLEFQGGVSYAILLWLVFVDFMIRSGNRISVIEVKTGRSTLHSSLDHLMSKYTKHLGQCYVLHTKDLRKERDLLYLPIYMAICL